MNPRVLLLPLAHCLLSGPLNAQRLVSYGKGIDRYITDMVVWDGKIVFGGGLDELLGVPVAHVSVWDGVQVYDFPGAFTTNNAPVSSLETLDGILYAGGRDMAIGNVARWDGSGWQMMDQGMPDDVEDLCVHNGQLIAAGDAEVVCAWNGATWDTLGARFNQSVEEIEVFNGQLYAGGLFTADVNGNTLARLARWNGTAWEQVGPGVDGSVRGMCVAGPGLVVCGSFDSTATGVPLPQGWFIFDGTDFTVPQLSPMPEFMNELSATKITSFPDGSYTMGDYLIKGNSVTDLGNVVKASAEFQGTWFAAGLPSNQLGLALDHSPGNGLCELIPEGRHYAQVDAGTMNATVTPGMALFERHWLNLQGLEVPKGDSTYGVYSSSPWLLGKQAGVWHASINRFHDPWVDDTARWAGPQQANVRDDAFYRRYHQVWHIDQYTIDQHAIHWNDGGYTAPYEILGWPGNGNTANGEPARLAPFKDVDGDGLYEPMEGDHPLIRGDEAAYWITHAEANAGSNLPLMAYDMHAMVYSYADPTYEDRRNSTFINLRFINRSGADYDSVRFALFTDMDLGGQGDDLTECDSTRGLWMTYNSDNDDLDSAQVMGFGTQPPAIGFKFLNEAMTAHRVWANDGSFDELDAFYGIENGVPFAQPGFTTHFQFPGGAWADTTVGDRRGAGATGPFVWPADDTLCFDLAVIYARADSGGPYASVVALKQRADAVQAWYDQQQFVCNTIEDVVAVRENSLPGFNAYPNPVTDRLTLYGPASEAATDVLIIDATGKTVLRGTWPRGSTSAVLDLSPLESGAYMVELRSAAGRRCSRVVKLR